MSDRSEWLRCKPWIEGALEYTLGTHTIEDIEEGIDSGRYQFFAGKNCAVITEILKYPRLTALNVFLCGGDLNELINEMEPNLSAWAKILGCKRVIGIGRKGFERAFKNAGFKPQWYFVMKEI